MNFNLRNMYQAVGSKTLSAASHVVGFAAGIALCTLTDNPNLPRVEQQDKNLTVRTVYMDLNADKVYDVVRREFPSGRISYSYLDRSQKYPLTEENILKHQHPPRWETITFEVRKR